MSTFSPSLIVAVLLVVVFGGLYGWLYVGIETKNAAVAEITAEIQSRGGEGARLEAMQSLVEETESERMKLGQYFVSNDEVTSFLSTIEALGSEVGVSVEILSVGQVPLTPVSELYEGLTVAVTSSGSFDQMVELLARFESLPYLVTIGQTRFEVRVQEKEREWLLSTSFTVLKKK